MLMTTKIKGINPNVEINSLPVLQSTILPQKLIEKKNTQQQEQVLLK